jgi:hypothetical protein
MSEGVEVIVARLERKLNENPNTVWLLFGADALRALIASWRERGEALKPFAQERRKPPPSSNK